MSRVRTDTLDSTSSFGGGPVVMVGLRERTSTNGSTTGTTSLMEFGLRERSNTGGSSTEFGFSPQQQQPHPAARERTHSTSGSIHSSSRTMNHPTSSYNNRERSHTSGSTEFRHRERTWTNGSYDTAATPRRSSKKKTTTMTMIPMGVATSTTPLSSSFPLSASPPTTFVHSPLRSSPLLDYQEEEEERENPLTPRRMTLSSSSTSSSDTSTATASPMAFSIYPGTSVATHPTSSSSSRLRLWVDWIQRQPVPTIFLPAVKRLLRMRHAANHSATTQQRNNHNKNMMATNRTLNFSNEAAGGYHQAKLSDAGGLDEVVVAVHNNEALHINNHNNNHVDGSDWMWDNNNNNNNDHQPDEKDSRLYCIRGLDAVLFGTQAAADCVVVVGMQPPRYLWYMISGAVCDVFQIAVDGWLHAVVFVGPNQSAVCWMTSFFLSIALRHSSHRYLVFGMYTPSYWPSLVRMYAGYSFSIVVSTVFNYGITTGAIAHVSHWVAYVATLLWTGLANYFILKRLWNMGGGNNNGGTNNHHHKNGSKSSRATPYHHPTYRNHVMTTT